MIVYLQHIGKAHFAHDSWYEHQHVRTKDVCESTTERKNTTMVNTLQGFSDRGVLLVWGNRNPNI